MKSIWRIPAFVRQMRRSVRTSGIKDVIEMEPALTKDIIAAYRTEDSSIDPFRAAYENLSDAIRCGHVFMPYTLVKLCNQ